MCLVTHLSACVWYFVGYKTLNDERDSWLNSWLSVEDKEDIEDMHVFDRYTYSWYWAVVTVMTLSISLSLSLSISVSRCVYLSLSSVGIWTN